VRWCNDGADGVRWTDVCKYERHGWSVWGCVGKKWWMLSNASMSTNLMSQRQLTVLGIIVLRPAVPTHLLVDLVHRGVE
jgi:hypothetical protein